MNRLLVADYRANKGHPKELAVVLSFRAAQILSSVPIVGAVAKLAHRFWTEMLFGIELRPETKIGPGLILFHGYGTVINTGSVLGADVKLHHGVTIGARTTGGTCPVIGDRVAIGAGALILGPITVGDGAIIGAGSVVTRDVESGVAVVGNPARPIATSASTA